MNRYILDGLLYLSAFIIGGIPTGYLVSYASGMGDIRKHGSGNIGASNMARIGILNIGLFFGLSGFFIVFLLDAGKAYLFLKLMSSLMNLSDKNLIIASLMLLWGNCYSLFLQFNGGKGVSTYLGIISFFSFSITLKACILWLIIWLLFRVPAYASLCTVTIITIYSFYFFTLPLQIICLFGVATIFIRHTSNITTFCIKI